MGALTQGILEASRVALNLDRETPQDFWLKVAVEFKRSLGPGSQAHTYKTERPGVLTSSVPTPALRLLVLRTGFGVWRGVEGCGNRVDCGVETNCKARPSSPPNLVLRSASICGHAP